jgi:hypothetical protein
VRTEADILRDAAAMLREQLMAQADRWARTEDGVKDYAAVKRLLGYR